jgi:hypothetical protein
MVLDGCVRVSIEIKKKGCGKKGTGMVGKKRDGKGKEG